MTRAPLALLALLVLGACARPGAEPAATRAETPAEAECRQEARESPAVRDLARQMLIGNQPNMDRVRLAQAEAEQRAFNDCLRRRGLSRGGGVEAVRRPDAIF